MNNKLSKATLVELQYLVNLNKLTLRVLGTATGYSANAIGKVLRGDNRLNIYHLSCLSVVLGKTVSEIIVNAEKRIELDNYDDRLPCDRFDMTGYKREYKMNFINDNKGNNNE